MPAVAQAFCLSPFGTQATAPVSRADSSWAPVLLPRPTAAPCYYHTDLHDVSVWRAHNAADKAAAAAAAASDAAEAARAEALLEQQLEQMLDEGAGDVAGDGLMDDYVDSDDTPDASSDRDDSDRDSGSGRRRQRQRQQQQQQHAGGKQPKQPKQPGRAAATKRGFISSTTAAAAASVAEPPPPSFSQVPIDAPESELRKQYPRFPGLAAASVVVLQAGDMLYLPAGWFHEVTSYGGPGAQAAVLGAGVAACCGLSAAIPCQPVR